MSQGPNSRNYNVFSLYVGDLDYTVTERDIFTAVREVASEEATDIESIKLVKDWSTGASLGRAYMNIKTPESQIKIQNKLNHFPIKGKKVRVYPQSIPQKWNKDANTFIRVGSSLDDRKLDELTSQFGKIHSAKYLDIVNPKTKAINFRKGFVQYDLPEEAQKAIDSIDGKSIEGVIAKAGKFIGKNDRPNKINTLIVKNLPENIDIDSLKQAFPSATSYYIFEKIHEINDIKVKCASLTFVDHEKAKSVMEDNNGKLYKNLNLIIELFMSKAERHKKYPPGLNLYISHIPTDVTEDALKALFSQCGKINSLRLMVDTNNASKGYGYCSFYEKEHATYACSKLNGYQFTSGFSIIVDMYKPPQERKPKVVSIPKPTNKPQQFKFNNPSHRPGKAGGNYPKKNNKKVAHQNKPQQSVIEIEPIPAEDFKTMLDDDKRELFGEKIYNYIEKAFPGINVGKITGMVLESFKNNYDQLNTIIENHMIFDKIQEAINVFKAHENK